MKKILLTLVLALASVVALANVAPPEPNGTGGQRILRFNFKTGMKISVNGVKAIEANAKSHPGIQAGYEDAFGTSDLNANQLEVVGSYMMDVGEAFYNSGIGAEGLPLQFDVPSEKNKEAFAVFCVRHKVTGEVVDIRDICGQPVRKKQRKHKPTLPYVPKHFEETSLTSEVNVSLNSETNIIFSPKIETKAEASATTGEINIVINNVTAGQPLMTAGSASPNQYYVVRDSQGFLQLGYLVGGGSRIKIVNTNINVNDIKNENVNVNNNLNENTNVINLGGGGKGKGEEPEPNDSLLAVVDFGPSPHDPFAEAGISPPPQPISVCKSLYFPRK